MINFKKSALYSWERVYALNKSEDPNSTKQTHRRKDVKEKRGRQKGREQLRLT